MGDCADEARKTVWTSKNLAMIDDAASPLAAHFQHSFMPQLTL